MYKPYEMAEHHVVAASGKGLVENDRADVFRVRMGEALGAERPTAGERRQTELAGFARGAEGRLAGEGETGFDDVLNVGR